MNKNSEVDHGKWSELPQKLTQQIISDKLDRKIQFLENHKKFKLKSNAKRTPILAFP